MLDTFKFEQLISLLLRLSKMTVVIMEAFTKGIFGTLLKNGVTVENIF